MYGVLMAAHRKKKVEVTHHTGSKNVALREEGGGAAADCLSVKHYR